MENFLLHWYVLCGKIRKFIQNRGIVMSDTTTSGGLRFLEDRWDDTVAATLDPADTLRYRSNLLGSGLRMTNIGGSNTSSKLDQLDSIDGTTRTILWVKGPAGELASTVRSDFATLYLDKLHTIESRHTRTAKELPLADLYPLVTFGNNPTAAPIDTVLHAFLPFPHVDHLHPQWAMILAASPDRKIKMEEFNSEFGHELAWLPWHSQGFERARMLRDIVNKTPSCDGVLLAGQGLFTWGDTQRACHLSTLTIIDHLGQFFEWHAELEQYLERYGLRKDGQSFGKDIPSCPNEAMAGGEAFDG